MITKTDLITWLKTQLSIDYVVTAPPVAEDRLPGAIVLYQGIREPDTCGGPLIEKYAVVLAARRVGNKPDVKQSDIGTLEGLLQDALVSGDRAGEWAHIQGSRTEGGDSYSVWEIEVWRPDE